MKESAGKKSRFWPQLFGWLLFIGGIVAVLVVGLVLWAGGQWLMWNWGWGHEQSISRLCLEQIGQFGDSFGAVNALFSGLAFVLIIVSLIYQRKELQAQRQEMTESSSALQLTTYLTTINAVHQRHEERIRSGTAPASIRVAYRELNILLGQIMEMVQNEGVGSVDEVLTLRVQPETLITDWTFELLDLLKMVHHGHSRSIQVDRERVEGPDSTPNELVDVHSLRDIYRTFENQLSALLLEVDRMSSDRQFDRELVHLRNQVRVLIEPHEPEVPTSEYYRELLDRISEANRSAQRIQTMLQQKVTIVLMRS